MTEVPAPLLQALQLLPVMILATAGLLITNLLRRGRPYVARVLAAVVVSAFLALPPLALALNAEPMVQQRPATTFFVFAVALVTLWLFLLRPVAARTDTLPDDRYLT